MYGCITNPYECVIVDDITFSAHQVGPEFAKPEPGKGRGDLGTGLGDRDTILSSQVSGTGTRQKLLGRNPHGK